MFSLRLYHHAGMRQARPLGRTATARCKQLSPSKAGRKCEWRAGGMEKGDPRPLGRLPGRCLWLPGESEQRAAGSRKDSRSGGAGPGVEGPGQDASFSQAV